MKTLLYLPRYFDCIRKTSNKLLLTSFKNQKKIKIKQIFYDEIK